MFDDFMFRLLPYTVPCTPDIVSTYLNCNSSSISLNWTSVMGAVSYTAIARAPGGQNSSCSTNITSCSLTQLACGQIYSITATASNGQCSSNQSAAVQVTSGTAYIIVHNSNIFVLNFQKKCLIYLFLPLPVHQCHVHLHVLTPAWTAKPTLHRYSGILMEGRSLMKSVLLVPKGMWHNATPLELSALCPTCCVVMCTTLAWLLLATHAV